MNASSESGLWAIEISRGELEAGVFERTEVLVGMRVLAGLSIVTGGADQDCGSADGSGFFSFTARMNWVREALLNRRSRQYNAPAAARMATMATSRTMYRACMPA